MKILSTDPVTTEPITGDNIKTLRMLAQDQELETTCPFLTELIESILYRLEIPDGEIVNFTEGL